MFKNLTKYRLDLLLLIMIAYCDEGAQFDNLVYQVSYRPILSLSEHQPRTLMCSSNVYRSRANHKEVSFKTRSSKTTVKG